MEKEGPLVERICDYVSRVDAELGVEKAFIFGSTAKGNRLKESDVDLIIVSKAFKRISQPRRLYLLQKLWGYREALNALAFTPAEFAKASEERLMMKEILSYAIELLPETEARASDEGV
jgi:predicted nucleotidyltransferase